MLINFLITRNSVAGRSEPGRRQSTKGVSVANATQTAIPPNRASKVLARSVAVSRSFPLRSFSPKGLQEDLVSRLSYSLTAML